MTQKIFRLVLCILLFASCGNQQNTASVVLKDSTVSSRTNDTAINQAVQKVYRAFLYRRNIDFDTAVAKKPFLPQANFIHLEENDSVAIEGLVSFVTGFKRLMKTNDIDSFIMEEVHGKTEQFGNIAERWSSYKMYVNTRDTVAERGINSFQLVKTNEGWRVSSMQREPQRKGVMLAPYFLKEDKTQK